MAVENAGTRTVIEMAIGAADRSAARRWPTKKGPRPPPPLRSVRLPLPGRGFQRGRCSPAPECSRRLARQTCPARAARASEETMRLVGFDDSPQWDSGIQPGKQKSRDPQVAALLSGGLPRESGLTGSDSGLEGPPSAGFRSAPPRISGWNRRGSPRSSAAHKRSRADRSADSCRPHASSGCLPASRRSRAAGTNR